ncbi:dipeptidase PepE [Streptomyces violaceusniger]|uniref:dipeptidase PepE n=1 Tax=Streptomyces violaceusniger TaxID=68280 RepID=UPI0009965408|nr:dipeptidase PepE [Streptomyces hygroscopicus]AQW53546.1 (alpha)-aspartyl dipeptidase [Streptomyces hygroscopicus]
MQLLLLSNSAAPGRGYLDHALEEIASVLDGARRLVFVPYALADHDGYTAKVAAALEPLGVEVTGAHTADDPAELVRGAQAVFVGGGNSFRLLKALHERDLIRAIRERVAAGAVYMGSSAGTNMACPTLRTSNDMPIVQPPTFEALGLLPFQINPHYLDAEPDTAHMGESRALRLEQFLEENDVPVVGLREGTWLRRDADRLTLGGIDAGAILFRRGEDPAELRPGADLSALLREEPRFDSAAHSS